jgi:hypothetical protein
MGYIVLDALPKLIQCFLTASIESIATLYAETQKHTQNNTLLLNTRSVMLLVQHVQLMLRIYGNKSSIIKSELILQQEACLQNKYMRL